MSILVQHLTKIYGNQKAVDNISFEAKKGEIVGYLGPNGAGKSTTMKIATCYIPPTSGSVEVCGYDVVASPIEVRRRIGYLPEHNPLYLDMYVHEYLQFIGHLHGLKGQSQANRNKEVIEQCGLGQEQNKLISALSKGYRQRVGLAQALIHDPEVLILDEPTTGLDPNQLVEIRQLIKEVSSDKTVIFSTHIMQEVQALCDRVVVINQGKIVADDPIGSLQSMHKKVSKVTAEFAVAVDITLLEEIDGVIEVEEIDQNTYSIHAESSIDVRTDIFNLAVEKNAPLRTLTQQEDTIEEVFHELTKTDTE